LHEYNPERPELAGRKPLSYNLRFIGELPEPTHSCHGYPVDGFRIPSHSIGINFIWRWQSDVLKSSGVCDADLIIVAIRPKDITSQTSQRLFT
jgi:hypothetical protein